MKPAAVTPPLTRRLAAVGRRVVSALNREVGTTVLELAGAASVTYGVMDIYRPAGFIVGGLLVGAIGWLTAADRPGDA